MAYLQDKNNFIYHKKRFKTVHFVLIGLFILVILFFVRKFFIKFSYVVSVPVVEAGASFERGMYSLFHKKSSLLNRIESLESENAELRSKLVDTAILENENSAFKNNSNLNETTIVSAVVAKPSKSLYDTLIVEYNGEPLLNSKVKTFSGVTIGELTDVTKNSGTVTLFSSPGFETTADLVLSDAMDSLSITMRGRGGGGFEAIISKDIIIPVGSLAVFPGVNSKPFAEVVKIVKRDDTKDQIVYFRSIVNFQYLRYVILQK